MARRNRGRDKVDQGRGFFETSSPFETYVPGMAGRPATFEGLTDRTPSPSPKGPPATGGEATDLAGDMSAQIVGRMNPEQYDNPRGFPGLALVTSGQEKSKLPMKNSGRHSITHHVEAQGALARTGKP